MKIPLSFSMLVACYLSPLVAAQSVAAPDPAAIDSLLLRGRQALERGGLPPLLLAEIRRAVAANPQPALRTRLLVVLGRHFARHEDVHTLDTVVRSLAAVPHRDETADADLGLLMAEWYRLTGAADSVLAHLERTLLLREGLRDWAGVAEVYVAYGRATDELFSDATGALSYYSRAVATARDRASDAAVFVEALLEAGHLEARLGRGTVAVVRYSEADTVARRLRMPGLTGLALYHRGVVQLELVGRVDTARSDLRGAVQAADGPGVYSVRARMLAHQRLGDIDYQFGSAHDAALAAYEAAINEGETSDPSDLLIGAYRNAGIIHAWWGRDSLAERFLSVATDVAERTQPADLAASNRGHWVTALVRTRRFADAVRALEPVRVDSLRAADGTLAVAVGALVQAMGDTVMSSNSFAFEPEPWARGLGTVPTMDGFFRAAIDMALARDDTETMLWALYEYGRSLMAAGRRREAERNFRMAWNQAARKGRDDERRALERFIR